MSNDTEKKGPWVSPGLRRAAVGLTAGLVAVAGAATYVSLSGPTTAETETALTTVQVERATAPRFVTGYSYHCSEEMDEADATGPEVDHVVENYYLSARYDEDQETWRYPGPTLVVVLNDNGFCVTVFRP